MTESKQASDVKPAPPATPPPAKADNSASIFTLAAAIIVATIGAVATVFTNSSAFDSKMVEIGVGMLSADPSKTDVSPARRWAIQLVQIHSGLKFSEDEREQLLHHALPTGSTVFLNSASQPLGLVAAGCSAWKKNADGSWTQTGKIVAGSATFEDNTLKNTSETKLLDQLCAPH